MACARNIVEMDRPGPNSKGSAASCRNGIRETELDASHLGVLKFPAVVTDGAPFSLEEDLQSSLVPRHATDKAKTNCKGRVNNNIIICGLI